MLVDVIDDFIDFHCSIRSISQFEWIDSIVNGILIQRFILNINRMHSFGMEFRCIRFIRKKKWWLMAHLL